MRQFLWKLCFSQHGVFYFTFDFTVSLVKLNYFIYKWKLFILEFFLDVFLLQHLGFVLKI